MSMKRDRKGKRAELNLYHLILELANENYKQAFAWSKPAAGSGYYSTSLNRLTHAEAQIEVLEIFNCGQVGGFDRGQEAKHRTLKGRLAWLKTHPRATATPNPSPTGEPKL
jgi:hypothetical protein